MTIGQRLPAGDGERQRLRLVVGQHELGDLVGHRPEQLVALLAGELAGGDDAVEQDLDVDLVVAAVDAGRVVDGVGEHEPAADGVLDAPELGQAEVAALADDAAAQVGAVHAHPVVGPVADVGVGLAARLDVRADAAVPQQVDGRLEHRRHQLVRRQRAVGRAEHGAGLAAEHDRLLGPRVHAAAGRDLRRVVVGPARPGQVEQPLALGEGDLRVGLRVDEDVAVVEGRDEAEGARAQHAVAEHVAGHVADADRRQRVVVGVLAEHAGVAAHALPGAAGRDPHRLVVVPGAATRGEGVAEPVAGGDGDLVGDVAERGRALVGGDHEVRVVAVAHDRVRWVHDDAAVGPGDQVVGEVEQPADEGAVALDDLGPQPVRVAGRALDDEATLGAGRHDDGVLHHLRLHQAEDLGAEVLPPIAPPQPAAGDRATAQVDPLDPWPAHPDLVLRAGQRQVGDGRRIELEGDRRPVAIEVRAHGGVDERQEGAADAVVVEAGDGVEGGDEPLPHARPPESSRPAGSKRTWNSVTRSATRRGCAASVSSTYCWLKAKPIWRRYLP